MGKKLKLGALAVLGVLGLAAFAPSAHAQEVFVGPPPVVAVAPAAPIVVAPPVALARWDRFGRHYRYERFRPYRGGYYRRGWR
jgi:hypothetical protein